MGGPVAHHAAGLLRRVRLFADPDAHRDGNGYRHGHSYANGDCDPDADSDADRHAHVDEYADGHIVSDGDAHADTFPDGHRDAHGHLDQYADAVAYGDLHAERDAYGEIGIGLLLPILLLLTPSLCKRSWVPIVAPLMMLFGVMMNRFNATMYGQILPPGTSYSPHLLEWLSTLGVLAAAVLAWVLGIRLLVIFDSKFEKQS